MDVMPKMQVSKEEFVNAMAIGRCPRNANGKMINGVHVILDGGISYAAYEHCPIMFGAAISSEEGKDRTIRLLERVLDEVRGITFFGPGRAERSKSTWKV